MAKIYISTKVFVPENKLDEDLVRQNFEFQSYNESACQRCPIYKAGERHSDQCDACEEYKGLIKLWSKKLVDGVHYIGLPPGQPKRLEGIFGLDLRKAVDLRPEIPFSHPIKFIGKLYDGSIVDGRQTVNQLQAAKDWWEKKNGIIQIPPRGGKTVLSIFIACKLGFKTLIIANKRALLDQFYDTIMGSDLRKPATNAREIEEKTGKKIVGIIEKMSDFEGLDIALITYQKFIKEATALKRIAKYINGKFSTAIGDEIHNAGAMSFLKFMSRLNCKYRISLSATPIRKDGADRMLRNFVGGVVAVSHVTAKIPTICLVETGVNVKNPYKLWVYAMKHLAQHQERNKMIVRDVFKDLRKGHHSVIIPIDFVAHGNTLVKMINRQAEINNIKRKENWPEPMAVFFTANIKKSPKKMQAILNSIDNGTHRVLVSIRSMIREGVDLSKPTVLYNVVPCSATKDAGSSLFYQLSQRVSTYHVGKKQPVVKIYVDGMGQSLGCLKSLFWMEIVPGLRKTDKKPAKYMMAKPEFERAVQLAKINARDYTPFNKPGIRMTSKKILIKQAKSNSEKKGFSSFGSRSW